MTPQVEQRITAWRTALLKDGFAFERVEELESHLLDAIADLRRENSEEAACDLALEALGDPRTAYEKALRFPKASLLAIAYVAFCGLATVMNELLLLANGRFDTGAFVGGIVCGYTAWRIWKRSRAWLTVWLVISVAALAMLVATLIVCSVVMFRAGSATTFVQLLVLALSILATAWQLHVFGRPATRILF